MTGSSSTKPIAVTGIGILTSLGEGKAENWRRLSAGTSGIHRLTRFPIDGLRTTIGGSVDFMALDPFTAPALSHAMAREAALEALAQSGVADERDGKRRFPGE